MMEEISTRSCLKQPGKNPKEKWLRFAEGTNPGVESEIALSITRHRIKDKKYIEYTIVVRHLGNIHAMTKRYKQFEVLHRSLCAENKDYTLPSMPKKRWFKTNKWDDDYHIERRFALQLYLRVVMKLYIHESKVLRDFLELKQNHLEPDLYMPTTRVDDDAAEIVNNSLKDIEQTKPQSTFQKLASSIFGTATAAAKSHNETSSGRESNNKGNLKTTSSDNVDESSPSKSKSSEVRKDRSSEDDVDIDVDMEGGESLMIDTGDDALERISQDTLKDIQGFKAYTAGLGGHIVAGHTASTERLLEDLDLKENPLDALKTAFERASLSEKESERALFAASPASPISLKQLGNEKRSEIEALAGSTEGEFDDDEEDEDEDDEEDEEDDEEDDNEGGGKKEGGEKDTASL